MEIPRIRDIHFSGKGRRTLALAAVVLSPLLIACGAPVQAAPSNELPSSVDTTTQSSRPTNDGGFSMRKDGPFRLLVKIHEFDTIDGWANASQHMQKHDCTRPGTAPLVLERDREGRGTRFEVYLTSPCVSDPETNYELAQ